MRLEWEKFTSGEEKESLLPPGEEEEERKRGRRRCLLLFNRLKDGQIDGLHPQTPAVRVADVAERVSSSVLTAAKRYFRLDLSRLNKTGSLLWLQKKTPSKKQREPTHPPL